MQFEALFRAAREKPVAAALIGAGEFGLSLIAQSRRMTGLKILAAADKDLARVADTLGPMAVPARRCDSAAAAKAAVARGEIALCESVADLLALPIEMVVEATGDAEAGTRHAAQAIDAGIGVTMVSKEAECVVGPALAARARKAGVGYTLVEGDQPALLIGLVSWARTLGLPIMAAGKSSEYDYVYDPATHRVTWTDRSVSAPALASLWALGADAKATIDKRAAALIELPQRTVPDNCEMALVANATGLVPDRPDFHAPMAHTIELPDLYKPRSDGGLLSKPGSTSSIACAAPTRPASPAASMSSWSGRMPSPARCFAARAFRSPPTAATASSITPRICWAWKRPSPSWPPPGSIIAWWTSATARSSISPRAPCAIWP
jgi:predicted homoserine dehydrogenase-like protein